MIKKIDILGMQLGNYTVRESIMQLDTYMSNTVLNIIETITMKQLILAVENEKVRACICQADLSVIGEREILADLGEASVQRMREIRDNDFLYELLKRVARNQRRIYLIAMTRREIEHMKEFFLSIWPKLCIEGSYAVEECTGDMDTIVNEINATTPDIVFSAMSTPFEEEFVIGHKDKISASVWYGLGKHYDRKPGTLHLGDAFNRLVMRGKVRHLALKYQTENEDTKKK